jgi:transcriptional regulator with PAS, ATPase and Fis domain
MDWELIGVSEYIQKLMDEITYVAKKIKEHDMSILIQGPSGSGKELIAKEIYKRSGRKPLISKNCAAIPRDLFESELFGYVRGAFTGAHPQGRKGLVEEAKGGILFLDEIGDLTSENQTKILRFLQEKSYCPVGSNIEKKITDIRVIVATNKDLNIQIPEGLFREDLYYRLNHRVILTQPLGELRADIICLLNHFVKTKGLRVDPKVKFILYSYNFPGNIRELESLLYSGDDYEYIKRTLTADSPPVQIMIYWKLYYLLKIFRIILILRILWVHMKL